MPDPTRCAGFVAEAHHVLCDRRFDCARFLDNTQAHPFRVSACEGGDSFVPVHGDESMPADSAAAHPKPASPDRVLSAHPSTPNRG